MLVDTHQTSTNKMLRRLNIYNSGPIAAGVYAGNGDQDANVNFGEYTQKQINEYLTNFELDAFGKEGI